MDERLSIERLTGLVAFARAATLGSYTAAARALGVSPSAVSKSVQRLERQLGITLFVRSTRSLALTSEGRDLHVRALRLLRETDDIEQAVVAARKEPSGTLRVTAPVPVGAHLLASALPRLHARFPKLSVELRVTDDFVDLIEEGIDVAVRIGELTSSELGSRRIGVRRVCAFASPAYLARRGTPTQPGELAGHDTVVFRYRSTRQLYPWTFRVGKRIVEHVPEPWLMVDSADALLEALSAGAGIGMSATYQTYPFVERGLLVPVLARYAVDSGPITALWPPNRRDNPNVRAFLALLGEVFPSTAPWDVLAARR